MSNHDKGRYWLQKKARRGFRGYPLATIAYYGPDDKHATKVAVGILTEQDELAVLERWFSEQIDVRQNVAINKQIVELLDWHHVVSVAITDRIIGCPHEEGKDYPEGGTCPHCPFWAGRDRWTGLHVN